MACLANDGGALARLLAPLTTDGGIAHGVSVVVNAADAAGKAPLHCATRADDAVVGALLAAGADALLGEVRKKEESQSDHTL